MVREVCLGAKGLIHGARKGTVISDCSSNCSGRKRRNRQSSGGTGASTFLDSPVTGSTGGADKATLTFMIGGDPAVYEKAKPYMEIMGKLFYYCGPAGQGLRAKVVQNMVGMGIFQAFLRRSGAGEEGGRGS
ncbi:MAG: NAD(P)-binding domain-containing protein [Acidobacteriota bacterium]